MVAIIDYGVGNLFSLKSSLAAIGATATVTADRDVIRAADRVILPGVGAFGDAAEKLRATGLADVVSEVAKSGKPIMGICLGMQLLLEKSFEYGEHAGLGLIKGEIRPIAEAIPSDLKIPHIGWNALKFTKQNPLFKYINDDLLSEGHLSIDVGKLQQHGGVVENALLEYFIVFVIPIFVTFFIKAVTFIGQDGFGVIEIDSDKVFYCFLVSIAFVLLVTFITKQIKRKEKNYAKRFDTQVIP